MDIPIRILSDDKGYMDRQCPNENCRFIFKINIEDWESKCSDEQFYCPMCGHCCRASVWDTEEQKEAISEIVQNYLENYILERIDKQFEELARSTRSNKYVKMDYRPSERLGFNNSPIGQREEWTNDITCEKCGTRYSVIGSAFFCPCCGHNSVVSVFDDSMSCIEKTIMLLPEMNQTLTEKSGRDTAEMICRSMLEGSLGDVVSAFQKLAHYIFKELSDKEVKVNDFQIVDKGSKLFFEVIGKGYDHWLSNDEKTIMNLFFQRRHILEHNAGIVDERYIDKSCDQEYALGQHVVVHADDVYKLLNIVKKLATGLKSLI